jgi:hypothetical protein
MSIPDWKLGGGVILSYISILENVPPLIKTSSKAELRDKWFPELQKTLSDLQNSRRASGPLSIDISRDVKICGAEMIRKLGGLIGECELILEEETDFVWLLKFDYILLLTFFYFEFRDLGRLCCKMVDSQESMI